MHRDTSILAYDFVLLHSLTYTLTWFPSTFAAATFAAVPFAAVASLRVFGTGSMGFQPSAFGSGACGGGGGGIGGQGGTGRAGGPFGKCGGRRGERGGLDNTIHIMYVYRDRVMLPSVLDSCLPILAARPSRPTAFSCRTPDYCCVCIPKCGCLTQV